MPHRTIGRLLLTELDHSTGKIVNEQRAERLIHRTHPHRRRTADGGPEEVAGQEGLNLGSIEFWCPRYHRPDLAAGMAGQNAEWSGVTAAPRRHMKSFSPSSPL